MKNDEIKINSKNESNRKESAISSKSDYVSESETFQELCIPIKKEKLNYYIIEPKLFSKITQHIENMNSFKEKLKAYKPQTISEPSKFSQTVKILASEFSIISKINNINNIQKPNSNSSMMSLFMNSQKGKEKDKEEISKLNMAILELTKKYQTETDNYKSVIKDMSDKIELLEKEIKNLNEKNELLIKRQYLNKTKLEIIYNNPKLLSKIISYLELDEKFNLAKCNIYLYKNLFFKIVSEKMLNIIKKKEKIIEKFSGEDLAYKFDIKENEISDLFRDYIINQKISGKDMRNEIVKSLIFLENFVKIPLENFKGPKNEKENMFNMLESEPKKPKFLSKFFSALKSELKEDVQPMIYAQNNYISFNPNEYVTIFDSDRYVLETFKTDKSLNVKFNYDNADKIKKILNDFFISQLPQTSYQKFITKICEIFPDLLYSSFIALNDIKNLEIVVYALYCRYMKYKTRVEELQSVIDDLNHFAESSKQIKEMMTKAKNELEFKYTNSIMTISQLNNAVNEKDEELIKIKSEIKEKEEKYEKFKNEIIKEYKNIKDNYNLTKKERDVIKNIFIELKNYFVNVVTKELLN